MSKPDKIVDHLLFDTSDMSVDMHHAKNRNRVILTIDGERQISLMRFYLKLKEYVEQMEASMLIFTEDESEH